MVATVDGITALSALWSVLPVVFWAPVILGLTPASFLPTSSATPAISLVLRLVSAVGLGMYPFYLGEISQTDHMVAPPPSSHLLIIFFKVTDTFPSCPTCA